ncbi:FadR/GntR family transcriptional regulator [Cupriavidus basilensis]|uniref:FadR/GntR family transcriptional regulator n=1 Tax=Cupriavidus basilensis TaxID=68895 RepID=A0ABT6AR58_9BURK|nr:FadR/GntR family transcriptional regulator [Cupriavidus basilensis]MDF3835075.1 FadR/GntR family transcriptional regulator [Cupriavidus basilensis]
MSSLQAVSAQRLYRLIADQIANKIRAGEFAPGERLPAERELAEQLNVARSTLREALIALEIGGYIEVRVGSGVFVVEPRENGRADESEPEAPADNTLAAALEASPFELLETRTLFEPECAALAARHGTPEQIGAIEEAHRRMKPDHSPQAGDFSSDRALHEAIAAACGNAALASVVTHVWDLCEASPLYKRLDKHFVDASAWRSAVGEHDRIVAAIVARDPIRARHAMAFHLLAIVARLSEDISQ